MFEKIQHIDDLKKQVAIQEIALVYIGQKNCSVCHGLKPQIENIMKKYSDVVLYEVDALDTPEVASEYQVLTVPVILLFVEGKEYIREARIVHTKEFDEKVAKVVNGYQSIKKGESLQ